MLIDGEGVSASNHMLTFLKPVFIESVQNILIVLLLNFVHFLPPEMFKKRKPNVEHKWEFCNHIFSSLYLKTGYNFLQNTFQDRVIRFCAVDGKVKRVYGSGSSGLWMEE